MQRTKIEWCDYTWNPVKGLCPVGCDYCYARRMYKRFGWDPEIRLDKRELLAPGKLQRPSKIFVGSTIELYHPFIPLHWRDRIIYASLDFQQHTIITLTKFPQQFRNHIFPRHWWLGTTMTGGAATAINDLWIRKALAKTRFISFEPLLSDCSFASLLNIDWIIIGGLTPKPVHKKEWIDRLVEKADKQSIPVFIKDNAHYPAQRREFPCNQSIVQPGISS